VLVDHRKGSIDLIPRLRSKGIRVAMGTLGFGDVEVVCGPYTFAVEVKTLSDILQCIADGRFAGHQLPGLIVSGYDQVWLLVEGEYRAGYGGILEVRVKRPRRKRATWVQPQGRPMLASDLDQWFLTMQLKGGIHVHHVRDRAGVASWLVSLDKWCRKGWEGHKSHLQFHDEHQRGSRDGGAGDRLREAVYAPRRPRDICDPRLLSPVGLARRLAAELPGIGYEKSKTITAPFGSPREFCRFVAESTKEDWESFDGLGAQSAAGIMRILG
jgi:ERCC4-type nuclease